MLTSPVNVVWCTLSWGQRQGIASIDLALNSLVTDLVLAQQCLPEGDDPLTVGGNHRVLLQPHQAAVLLQRQAMTDIAIGQIGLAQLTGLLARQPSAGLEGFQQPHVVAPLEQSRHLMTQRQHAVLGEKLDVDDAAGVLLEVELAGLATEVDGQRL